MAGVEQVPDDLLSRIEWYLYAMEGANLTCSAPVLTVEQLKVLRALLRFHAAMQEPGLWECVTFAEGNRPQPDEVLTPEDRAFMALDTLRQELQK